MPKQTLKPDRITHQDIDVDTRFLLANERTLLAWIRTALTVIAGGLALAQLTEGVGKQFGVLAIAFGAATAWIGYLRYNAADRAIRTAQLPSRGSGPALQVAGVIAFAAAIIVIEII